MTEIYMDRRAFEFFRSFPDVPEVLRPVYGRFLDAGLLWVDHQAEQAGDFPGPLRWTERGQQLRDDYFEAFPSGTVNFFTETQMRRALPDGDRPDPEWRIFKDAPENPGVAPSGDVIGRPSTGLKPALLRLNIALEILTGTLGRKK